MRYTDDEAAIIWLCACTDYDYRERAALLRAAKIPSFLFTADEKFFVGVIKSRKNGLYKEEYATKKAQALKFIASQEEKGRFFVTLVSDDYPSSLKQLPDPPLVLYGAGNRSLLSTRKFTVVGSRITPAWAEAAGRKIAEELTEFFTVVTGFAEGGDGAAIAGALPSGKLICVLANGLDQCYPSAHFQLKERVEKRGLLLSEYPPDEKPMKYNFPARNRLLAALSEGVFVLSAGMRSGALITANHALDCGKDVFAFPHNAGVGQGEGCNMLIKNGAFLVTETEDILSNYGLRRAPRQTIVLEGNEASVYEALRTGGEMHVAKVAEVTNLRIYEATAALAALEMKGLVTAAGANRYAALK